MWLILLGGIVAALPTHSSGGSSGGGVECVWVCGCVILLPEAFDDSPPHSQKEEREEEDSARVVDYPDLPQRHHGQAQPPPERMSISKEIEEIDTLEHTRAKQLRRGKRNIHKEARGNKHIRKRA